MISTVGNKLMGWVPAELVYRLPAPIFKGEVNTQGEVYIELPDTPTSQAALAMIGYPTNQENCHD